MTSAAGPSSNPSGLVQGRGVPARPALFKSSAPPPSPVLEAAVRRFMARDAKKIFTAHWEEAKRRLGPWDAGLTLRSFIEKNTQEIDLDPWAQAAKDEGADANQLRLRYTGSNNPLTYDCLLVFCNIAPTTRNPSLFHLESRTLIPVSDSVILFRKGLWYYAARPPIPEEGKVLEKWEHVRCLTARFTVPWAEPEPEPGMEIEMDGAGKDA